MADGARSIAVVSPLLAILLGAAFFPPAVAAESDYGLARGKLLVARESLRDPNFARTVLLILSCDETGAAAVVLNRPSHMKIDHLLPGVDLLDSANETVYIGGPVAVRHATILASAQDLEGSGPSIVGNVYLTADLSVLERMATNPQPGERFRVYAGHAGWAAGQLEHEMRRRSWFVLPATEAIVFSDGGDELWEELIRRTRSRIATRQLPQAPEMRRQPVAD